MKRLLSLIILLFTISCSTTLGQYRYTLNQYNTDSVVRDIPVLVDMSFDNDDRAAIDDAIAQWNYALNGWEHIYIVGSIFVDDNELGKHHDGWLFVKGLSTDKVVKECDAATKPDFALGFANAVGGNRVVVVRERIGKADVFGVMLHEIGHLLGAEHDAYELMTPHYSRYYYQCIDKDALKEVADHEKLPLATLNYCTLG